MVKEFNELIGKTIMRIETSNEVYSNELSGTNDIVHENRQIWFYMNDGSKFHMYHDQLVRLLRRLRYALKQQCHMTMLYVDLSTVTHIGLGHFTSLQQSKDM